jgi:hypothetical protein
MHPSPELLRDILSSWGLTYQGIHPEIPIQGSPERCLYRVVVEAGGSRLISWKSWTPAPCHAKIASPSASPIWRPRDCPWPRLLWT